ncbi:hypothetical protein JCM3765_000302 [Sporobolomyces pararoseus]
MQVLAPSRSSSTDSTETVRPYHLDMEGERPVTIRTAHSSERSRERSREEDSRSKKVNDGSSRRSGRPSSSSSTSRSSSRSVPHALRPLSPTSNIPPSSLASHSRSSSSKIPRRPRSSQSSATELPRKESHTSAPSSATTSRRPSLTLSTKRLCSTSTSYASLPSPAPSPSRLCPALPLPLLSTNEALIQVSSVVVEGELDVKATNCIEDVQAGNGSNIVGGSTTASVGAGGTSAKELLETLRDKGTLIPPEEDLQIPGLSQPFVLPALERDRNPLLPLNLFDCTGTISIPDLPPTGDSEEEDEIMNMLPSPISPVSSPPPFLPRHSSAAAMHRSRSRSSGGNRHSNSGSGGKGGSHSQSSSRKVSFSIDSKRASQSPPPSAPPAVGSSSHSRRSSGSGTSILKTSTATGGGKRRQSAGLGTTRQQELLLLEPSSSRCRSTSNGDDPSELLLHLTEANQDRMVKKRPALISFTSFEEEFGLKPPRLDTDYDQQLVAPQDADEGETGGEEKEPEEGRKERKWWHLSG